MEAKKLGTLLVVDDEPEIREIIEMNVAPLGFTVLEAADGQQAFDVVKQHHVDVILSDLMMPRMTGIALLAELRDAGYMQPFIFLTAYPSQDSTIQALRLGAFDYLEKPFEGDELRALLKEAMRVSLEMQRLGVRQVKDGTQSTADRAADEIQKLRTLRYSEGGTPTAADPSNSKLRELFVAEALPQLLFCEASIKNLAGAEERAFELGYLFRVMQGIAAAAESITEGSVVQLARAAERFYTTLRVRPRAVTEDFVELASAANTALQQAITTLGQGDSDAVNARAARSTIEALMRAADELEGGGVRAAG